MSPEHVAEIRRVNDRLRALADEFPDFHYIELSGPAVADKRLAEIAVRAAIGDATAETLGAPRVVECVYGLQFHRAAASLAAIADEVWFAARLAPRHFRLGGDGVDAATGTGEVVDLPAVRETGTPFILIRTMLCMAMGLPRAFEAEIASFGVRPPSLGGNGEVYRGAISVKDGCLLLPGGAYVLPGHVARRDYVKLCDAARRGELSALHSLHSVFRLIGGFLESCLVLNRLSQRLGPSKNKPNASCGPTQNGESDLIAPSEQASMLGWKSPRSGATLKRVASLRDAVIARGMKLDVRRVEGKGNKTFVLRSQWEQVVALFHLMSTVAPTLDQAVAAIGSGKRLMNRAGDMRSYFCSDCAEITRTDATEPVCKGCGQHEKLCPITKPRK
jgi:hypothetical protein